MALLTYDITQEILDSGCGYEGGNCPNYVAAAPKLAKMGWRGVHFGSTLLYLRRRSFSSSDYITFVNEYEMSLPDDVRGWIRDYERREGGYPESFSFDVPTPEEIKAWR